LKTRKKYEGNKPKKQEKERRRFSVDTSNAWLYNSPSSPGRDKMSSDSLKGALNHAIPQTGEN
jgi:hypothetical protein